MRAFERGEHRDAGLFAAQAVVQHGLPIAADEFLRRFVGWVSEPLPGAAELLARLRRELPAGTRIGCLSNTNALHEERILGWLGEDAFDVRFLSHRTGQVKPDRDAYTHACETLGLEPPQVWFADDAAVNVEAALAVGLRAFRARGPGDVARRLEQDGLLPTGSLTSRPRERVRARYARRAGSPGRPPSSRR